MAEVQLAQKLQVWPITKLIPYEKNARTHSDDQIEKIQSSMIQFGFNAPILVDGESGIIAGHGRLMAAKKLGLKEVPVVVLTHMTDYQKRAYILADNKLGELSGWDHEMLKEELAALREDPMALESIGFSDLELAGMEEDLLREEFFEPKKIDVKKIERRLEEKAAAEKFASKDADDAPEVSDKAPAIKVGDVFRLGRHRLMCGDSTDLAMVEKLVGKDEIDLFLTDPPYNVAYVGKTKEAMTIENDQMVNEDFRAFLVKAFANAHAVMKPGACFYIWHADSEGYNFRGACHDVGLPVRQCLIWNKDSMVMGRQDYHWKHEPCLYGWKEGAAHLWNTDRTQVTVLNFARHKRNDIHPTMKPVNLIEYQILNNTKDHHTVLDLFIGSGSTIIAAERVNRSCYGMELDPKYCAVILDRWQKFTDAKATREDGIPWDTIREA